LEHLLQQTFTDPSITKVILCYLSCSLKQLPAPLLATIVPNASPQLRQAVFSQNRIGWQNFLKGRLSTCWGTLYQQTHTHPTNLPPSLVSSDSWGVRIIHLTWEFIIHMWYSRNDVEHSSTTQHQSLLKTRLLKKIGWLHELLPPEARYHFQHLDCNALQKSPMSNLYMLEQQLLIFKQSMVEGGATLMPPQDFPT
jgi:hypothetical protein